jgi:alkaline phosphatase
MVVTSKITDATPACFASHVLDRDFENAIAEQLIGLGPLNRTVDLMFGGILPEDILISGGRCHFLPKGNSESCRSDDKDLLHIATQEGITYISDRTAFDTLNHGKDVNLPLLGLFSSGVRPFHPLTLAHVLHHRPQPPRSTLPR